jgi:hypothetical protein
VQTIDSIREAAHRRDLPPDTISLTPSSGFSEEKQKHKNRVPLQETRLLNEGDGVRTRNHRIDSPVRGSASVE